MINIYDLLYDTLYDINSNNDTVIWSSFGAVDTRGAVSLQSAGTVSSSTVNIGCFRTGSLQQLPFLAEGRSDQLRPLTVAEAIRSTHRYM